MTRTADPKMDRAQAEAAAVAMLDLPDRTVRRRSFAERFLVLVGTYGAGAVALGVLADRLGGLVPVWAFLGGCAAVGLLFVARFVRQGRG